MACDCIEIQDKALLEQNLVLTTQSLMNMKTDKVRQVIPIPIQRAYSDRPKSKMKFMIPVFCAISFAAGWDAAIRALREEANRHGPQVYFHIGAHLAADWLTANRALKSTKGDSE